MSSDTVAIQTTKTLSLLNTIGTALQSANDLMTILEQLAYALREIIGSPQQTRAILWKLQNNHLQLMAASPLDEISKTLQDIPITHESVGVIREAISKKKSQFALNPAAAQIQIAVPVLHRDTPIAVINLEITSSEAISSDELTLLETIAGYLAVTLAYHPNVMDTRLKEAAERAKLGTHLRRGTENILRKGLLSKALIEVNNQFEDFIALTSSETPYPDYLNILTTILPHLSAAVGADVAMVFTSLQADTDDEATDLFKLTAWYGSIEQPAPAHYTLSQRLWNEIAHQKGVHISTISAFIHDYEDTMLPFLEWKKKAEIAMILVGQSTEDTRLGVVFVNLKDPRPELRRSSELTFKEQNDVFDVIVLRLRDYYNVALITYTQLCYDRERRDFIEDVMHQLNTTVVSLLVGAENFVTGVVKPEDYPAKFKRLYQIAKMFDRYTATFSLAAHAESRSITEVYATPFRDFTNTDLVNLLKEHCDYFVGKAQSFKIKGPFVVEESFANLPTVVAHKELLELVVFNLLDNAVKYSRQLVHAPISIQGGLLNDGVIIQITDHGIPLTQEDIDSVVFHRYKRSNMAQNYSPNGTGIGLHLCDKIMQALHGRILVEPSVDSAIVDIAHEVIFTLWLPIKQPANHPA